MSNVEEYFNRWFVGPLGSLESIPNGDGGFIALATCCFLYERYAIAKLASRGKKADANSRYQQLAQDFDTDLETARMFWYVFRDGILHQGLPKQADRARSDLPGYILHHSFVKPIQLADWGGQDVLKIQPWRFMHKVLELWEDDTELLDLSSSFPFPSVM